MLHYIVTVVGGSPSASKYVIMDKSEVFYSPVRIASMDDEP